MACRSKTSTIWWRSCATPRDEFIRIEFDQRQAETLVFPRDQMMAATDEILNDNDLRSQGSPDAMAVWTQAKTSK